MSKGKNSEQLSALVRLLDDPNEAVYSKVKEQIFLYGTDAIPTLEALWENSFDEITQQRSLNLIHEIQFQKTQAELNNWACSQSDDLLSGYIIVSKYNYPELDQDKTMSQAAKIIQDVWLELNNNLTALEKIKVINHVIFELFHFRNNLQNIGSPESFFINNLFETKTGNTISLGILYLVICQNLKIPVYGVDLPKHFILAYIDEIAVMNGKIDKDEVLFYLNPFNRGNVFTKNEIDLFVRQMNLMPDDSYYLPCDNKTIIYRLIKELIDTYSKLGYTGKVSELEHLLVIVRP